jgi:protein TonB
MALRCFLFSSDEGTSDIIRQVLTGLGVEGESCPDATTAIEIVGSQSFQLVVIDWDQQPEAGLLLATARERKAADRPLTLAIVSDDATVPKALQAGANSILRRPLTFNQATDTLTTARDLLRSRQESADRTAQAAAAAASAGSAAIALPSNQQAGKESTLRAGEFLQAGPTAPGGQYETESEKSHSVASEIDPLKDLEPVASSVPVRSASAPPLPPPPAQEEPRSLEALLKSRRARPAENAPVPPPPDGATPELLGYDQNPSTSAPQARSESKPESPRPAPEPPTAHERKKEAELFAYIDGGSAESKGGARIGLGKGAIMLALALAGCAIVAAPQAPWHPRLLIVAARSQRLLHGWLNPQPVTTLPAPTAHENFGRPGDEYKLPVAENIPDATTDPSQIHVLPVIDPTAKKPVSDATNPDQTAAPADGSAAPPIDAAKDPAVQTPEAQPVQTTPEVTQPAGGPVAVGISAPPPPTIAPPSTAPSSATPGSATPSSATLVHTEPTAVVTAPPPPKATPRQPSTYVATTKVPSSLQSQMVSMTPDASGNKSPEAALPSIEPVAVPELTERALLTVQPPLAYPPNAGGRTGTVVLEVLIGRDGAVQDAKFLQGSLAFARNAIDGARQWKFKPYTLNGRPVSVRTTLTIKFQPMQ